MHGEEVVSLERLQQALAVERRRVAVLERAAILCDGGLITEEHLSLTAVEPEAHGGPPGTGSGDEPDARPSAVSIAPPPAPADLPADLSTMERTMIEHALRDARFNKSKAAKTLGLTRHQLYIRMREHGLD